MFTVIKTYDHTLGLSAAFRQHRAKSHCRFIHGYPLSFQYLFGAYTLDENNWVIDFGDLKTIKQRLVDTYDHKLLVAKDDPQRVRLVDLGNEYKEGEGCSGFACPPIADVLVVEAVGCEAFAKMEFEFAHAWLLNAGHAPRVQIMQVTVREHGGNAAAYGGV